LYDVLQKNLRIEITYLSSSSKLMLWYPFSVKFEIFIKTLFAIDCLIGPSLLIDRAELKIRPLIKLDIGPVVQTHAKGIESLSNTFNAANFIAIPRKYQNAFLIYPWRRSTILFIWNRGRHIQFHTNYISCNSLFVRYFSYDLFII
jgi:hypothetical protein